MKRFVDFILAACLLLPLMPVILLLMLAVRIKLGSPIFFRQTRPGLHGKPFHMLKFRTMANKQSVGGDVPDDSERLSSFGCFLRTTSLDELPELWNVIKGDMSLVGPRPLLMEYLPLYSTEQARRHGVRPGITGWAQVNGRNAISWEEKFRLDNWYIDNRSLWLDIKILTLTVWHVFRKTGINQEGHVTIEKFRGNISQEAR